MHPDSTTTPEDFFLDRVRDGSLGITAEGSIVRLIDRRSNALIVAPRSVEHLNNDGYLCVLARFDGRTYSAKSHRIIHRHFLGPIPPGMEINHKNGVKTDNRPVNLECVSRSENQEHAYRLGLNRGRVGELNGNSALSDVDAAEIRRAYAASEGTQQSLADRYGVTRATVGYLVRGQTRAAQAGPTSLNNVRRKLTEGHKAEVLALWLAGGSTKEQIGERYGVTRQAIYFVLKKAGCL